jgi:hypothetical protein
VARLQNLTYLGVISGEPADEACDSVLDAIGQLSKLEHLKLDDSLFGAAGHDRDVALPRSWSGLSALRQLELTLCRVDMPSLFPLAHLTSLSVDHLPARGGEGPPQGVDEREVPQQWRDGLQRLTWADCGRDILPTLSQLTALVSLHLTDAGVTPELCR